jgi:NADPH-dependent glutamate synthase beta subunit-like oxidoreductase
MTWYIKRNGKAPRENNNKNLDAYPCTCEKKSCVLGIIEEPVAIENIEKNIIERGFAEG